MLSSVDNESSLPLKKRQLRTDFTCIDELAVPHSATILPRDVDISSSGRSSVSSLDLDKESIKCIVTSRTQLSPNNSELYCPINSFSLLCHGDDFDRPDRYITIATPKCFISPSVSYRSAGHSFPLKEETNSSISSNISSTTTEASFPLSHSPPSSIYCSPCNKHFRGRAKYQAHVRRHNSKLSGRYQCSHCSKRFVQRSSLVTHLRIHTGEKPYKCDFRSCSECFSDYSTYTKHVRTHTGEKPYICPVCMRAFSQSGNMHRHLKGVHKQHVRTSDLLQGKVTSRNG